MSGLKNCFASKFTGGACTPTHLHTRTSAPLDRMFLLPEIRSELVSNKNVRICCFPDTPLDCAHATALVGADATALVAADATALVAIDVIRATTTAITAISMGRKCHVAHTIQSAFDI